MTYRPDIDGLRTLAVLPVVLFHANVAGFSGGFVGVDIFFVISGFLITTIIHRELGEERFSILRFYERRARRILPALFAVMVASLVAGWFLLPPSDYDHMGQSILSALLFVSNMWFWQNSGGYFAGATDYLPMLHTWSLAVEEQFYIFFPLLLMLLHRIGRRLLLPVIAAIVLGSLLLAIWATPKMPSASFYLLPTRVWELGFGALLALGAAPAQLSRPLREGLAALGLLAVLVPVFLYDSSTIFPGLAALPPVAGAALLIWTGGAGTTLAARLLSLRPLVFVGLISYSLYLWHWPIMAFVRNRFLEVELNPDWQVITVAASLGTAWLSWRFVERPFRMPPHSGGMTRGRIFAVSGAGTTVLAALAGGVLLTHGAALRFSPQELSLIPSNPLRNAFHDACFGAPIENLCTFGGDGGVSDADWVLWGDSHADAILPAFIELAENQNKKLVFAGLSGCPPLPGITRSDMSVDRNQDCVEFNNDVMRMIESSQEISSLFIHARWPLYVSGKYTEDDGPVPLILSENSDIKSDENHSSDNEAILEKALEGVVRKLSTPDLHITIVGAVPEMPWDVFKHLSSRALLGFHLPPTPSREDVMERHTDFERVVLSLTSRTHLTYYPIAEEICTPQCLTHDATTSYYRDDDHLSPAGVRTLVLPILTRFLEPQVHN